MGHFVTDSGEYIMGSVQPANSQIVPQRPTIAHSWNGTAWVFDGFSDQRVGWELRRLRDIRLFETDWWANSDLTMTDAQTAYRTALRNLPATATDVDLDENNQLTGVTWPTKP
jgi:hypothetical protein